MCVLIFCTNTSEIFLFPGRNEGDIINVHRSSCKVIVINIRKLTLNILGTYSKNLQIQIFMKIHPVGAELFHADRRTYTQRKLIGIIIYYLQLFSTHDDWGIFSSDI